MGSKANELTSHERAGIIVRDLIAGDKLTTREVMARTGLTYSGAYYMMCHLSRKLQIRLTDEHQWVWIEETRSRL